MRVSLKGEEGFLHLSVVTEIKSKKPEKSDFDRGRNLR